MHEKLLGFGHMHENQTYIFFSNESLCLNVWIFLKFWRKIGTFNIRSVSYSVSLQPDIIQNYWKNIRGTHKYF